MGVIERSLALVMLCCLLVGAAAAFPSTPAQLQNGLPVNGCALQTDGGLVNDRDCDGWDDFRDNCKYTPNADQRDSNRNGVGDACDLLITTIDLDPATEVEQGQFFTVRVTLLNNKEYSIDDIQARIRNLGLDMDLTSFVERMAPDERRTIEFVLKAPGCAAPGRYELAFTTDHYEGDRAFTQLSYQRITLLEKPGACVSDETVLGNTVLDTITLQEAEPGDRVIYPLTILNLNPEAKSYRLSLDSISYLGSYRIDSEQTFTVPAGKSHTAYLYIETERFAPAGRNTLRLNLESEGETEQTTLTLRIIKSSSAPLAKIIGTAVNIALVLIVLALIIGAGVVAYKKLNGDDDESEQEPRRKRRKTENPEKGVERVEEDEDFESYY